MQRLLQRPSVVAWPQRTVGPNVKKPAKNEIQKIREIDGSYSCLQQYCTKRKLCEFAETGKKTREITNFWRIFGLLEPLCHSGQRPGQAACTDFRQRPEK